MNKAEIITALEGKYYRVAQPTLTLTDNGIKRYQVTVFELKNGDCLSRLVYQFYVEDEGQPTEMAYWEGREPAIDLPSFEREVETYIGEKIADETIEAAFIQDISDHERAIADAYVVEGADIVKKIVLVDKYLGQIRHRVIS